MLETNRLKICLEESRRNKRKIFCAFLTLGFPDLATTGRLIKEFEAEGVDILELGFPFSDPLADGPTIQYSSEWALRRHVHVQDAFDLIARLRKEGLKMPVIFFTYLNPVLQLGFEVFARKAQAAGFDGVIIPDLPPEEEPSLGASCRGKDLARIFLVSPTTEISRARMISRASEGFIYYVSLRGVTGARKSIASDVKKCLHDLKKITDKPILIGFGVSSPEQARELSSLSDGVIVGSAIVEQIRKSGGKVKPVIHFIRSMIRAIRHS